MGDADSDIIYLEAFPSSYEEMEDDDDSVPESSDEETGGAEGFKQQHGSEQQTGENDELCKQLQRLEDDGPEQAANSAEGCLKTYKAIEAHTMSAGSTYFELSEPPSFEAFLCPKEREHILKTGWGTQAPYKKPSSVSWDEYSEMFDTNGYYKFINMPVEDMDLVARVALVKPMADRNSHIAASHVSNENSAEYNTPEKRPEAEHIDGLDILDDCDELQVERGIVRKWACVNFSPTRYKHSVRFLDTLIEMCIDIGMEFAPFPKMDVHAPLTSLDIRRTLLDVPKEIDLLIVFLPQRIEAMMGKSKRCVRTLVAYQFCIPFCLMKRALYRVACESKVVMSAVRRRRLELPLVSEAPMIIFGAHMIHCAPGEDSEAIASVVASLDWPKFRKYRASISHQPHNEGIINLHTTHGGMMTKFIRSFDKIIKENPKSIIFFRNGLKEGQFGYICQQEIDAIKQTTSFVVCYCVVHDDNNFPAGELQSLTSKLCTL
ncbi:hypothetical protein E2562_003027 [Oryza meyeriana var. granulata]|uniref:Piwi domain-containing protein n=1 Tax=Oryza meyeriana var. granulata TaxID=110450 RepID=A0A6G1DEG4_9ORYZ|nr:hypothetical protein E2562_003027 [Oryza meyeriana var. granulata]